MGKSVATNVLAIANKREKEYLKETKDGIVAKVQEALDSYAQCMREWEYIIYTNGSGMYKGYKRSNFPGQDYSKQQLEKILSELGFWCKFDSNGVYISIPMWKKGEKKTRAQLMLYHHLKSVKKAIKEKKEKEEAQAKEDFQHVLSQLESGDFESKLGDDGNYLITIKLAEGRREGTEYRTKLKSLVEKRGFILGYYEEPDTKLVLYLPKKK